MRKRIYILYNYLASYPVICVLCAATVLIVYSGRQYHPLESKQQAMLLQNMELSQKRQELGKELTSLQQEDLRKRYILFNQDFLPASEAYAENLKNTLEPAFEAHGWRILSSEVARFKSAAAPEFEATSGDGGIQGLEWILTGSALQEKQKGDESFLPLYSLTQCIHFLWGRSPVMECRSIEMARVNGSYEMTLRFFLPLRDTTVLNEPIPLDL